MAALRPADVRMLRLSIRPRSTSKAAHQGVHLAFCSHFDCGRGVHKQTSSDGGPCRKGASLCTRSLRYKIQQRSSVDDVMMHVPPV